MPVKIADALGRQGESAEALRIQRYEIYDASTELNAWHIPIGLGDIFRVDVEGKDYILLAQPCDLVVRSRGLRNHEKATLGRMATVVEIMRGKEQEGTIWGKLPFYEDDTGDSAFANFGRVHHVSLAVLDLCVLQPDGLATVDVQGDSPDLLVEAWEKRLRKLQNRFGKALKLQGDLAEVGLNGQISELALPAASSTLKIQKAASGRIVKYGVRRVMRLRQPWSGALLTEFAQYQARVAFEHHFGYRVDAP